MKTETTPKAETESRTRIQAYSKSQLAGLYLPHICLLYTSDAADE